MRRATNATYKSTVSLTDDRVESFEHIPGVQANFTVDEFAECDRLLRSHPDVVAALSKRGITDIDLVFFDTWTYGNAVAPPEYRDRRIGWSDTWMRDSAGGSPYAQSRQRTALRHRPQRHGVVARRGQWPVFWGRRREARGDGRIRAEHDPGGASGRHRAGSR